MFDFYFAKIDQIKTDLPTPVTVDELAIKFKEFKNWFYSSGNLFNECIVVELHKLKDNDSIIKEDLSARITHSEIKNTYVR